MTTVGVTGALRAQNLNEAIVSSQSGLRRVTEVFTQELRSTVLGGVSNRPYASNDHQVSFITLTGGAGDPVVRHDQGQDNSFEKADNLDLVWGDPGTDPVAVLSGRHILLVNGLGQAIVLKVTNVRLQGAGTYNVVHAGCANTIAYTAGHMITIQARSVGYRFDAPSGTLFMTEDSGPEVPVAFHLASVAVEYVYVTDGGRTLVRSTPLTDALGVPARSGTIGGERATLQRVGLVVSASEGTRGRGVERTVSSDVEVASRRNLVIDRVTECR
jgi:hypothetical protein